MTASLPAPHEGESEDPDDGRDGAVVPLSSAADGSAKRPSRTASAKVASKPKIPVRPTQVPAGPPPPAISADLAAAGILVPPRPPLPARVTDDTRIASPVTDASSLEEDGASADDGAPAEDEAVVEDGAPVDDEVATVTADAPADDPSDDEEELLDDTVIVRRGAPVAVVGSVVERGIDVEPEPEPEPQPEPESAQVDVVAPVAEILAAPATQEDALVIRGITKSFGDTRAVEGIDLTVPAGTFYGLVGPNGAGKTTTLSMIAGLLRPDKGTVTVAGVDAASRPLAAKRMMGVLPDRLRTFDRLTGRQLLYYYGVLRGLSPAVVERRTADLARAFDLTDALGRVVSDYSAGMTKKVMLAGALIHSPRVLVLDEPFESVDPVSSAIILDILSTYVAHGGTVILSSHGMELVERVCSRVAVIVAGQVLAEGTIDEVRGELTLEQRFIELAGGLSDVEGLEWLHTFSD